MDTFYSGFEKAALEEDTKKMLKRYVAPAAAVGTAAALGTYTLSRRGGKRLVTPVVYEKGKAPTTALGRFIDRIRYGADEVLPVTQDTSISKYKKRVLKPDEVAYVRRSPTAKILEGNKSQMFGSAGITSPLVENKGVESRLLRQTTPHLHPKTEKIELIGGNKEERLEEMKALHEAWKGKGGYYIKPVHLSMSGPGGEQLLSNKDFEKYLVGKLKGPKANGALKDLIMGASGDYIIQRKMKPVRDPVTGKLTEFRVHSVGGKVLDTTLRAAMIPNPFEARKARKAMEEFISKMPQKLRDNKVTFAADVLKTKDGYKIVELNPGGMSGYLDPNFMGKKGLIQQVKSILLNNKLYREISGRKSPLSAAGASAGAGVLSGAATAGGILAYDKKDQIAERFTGPEKSS